MSRNLPPRPNLDYLRSSAKSLLARLRSGDPEAARTLIAHLPDCARLTEAEVFARGLRLADVQFALARASGFATWPALVRHVDSLRNLEGTWGFRSLEIDGAALPPAMLSASVIQIDGDRFRMESPEATYEGVFQVDIEALPNQIDIAFNEGPEAGKTAMGIFEVDIDRLTLCLGLVGSTRPESFTTAPGSGHALERLIRISQIRPNGVDGGVPPQAPPVVTPPLTVESLEPFETTDCELLHRLQGEWSAVEMTTAGKAMDRSYLPFGVRITSGSETKVVFGGQTMLHAMMRINESADPASVDYMHLGGQHQGKQAFGIFRWEGEDAVFAIAPPGRPRPNVFASNAANQVLLSIWRRKAGPAS